MAKEKHEALVGVSGSELERIRRAAAKAGADALAAVGGDMRRRRMGAAYVEAAQAFITPEMFGQAALAVWQRVMEDGDSKGFKELRELMVGRSPVMNYGGRLDINEFLSKLEVRAGEIAGELDVVEDGEEVDPMLAYGGGGVVELGRGDEVEELADGRGSGRVKKVGVDIPAFDVGGDGVSTE